MIMLNTPIVLLARKTKDMLLSCLRQAVAKYVRQHDAQENQHALMRAPRIRVRSATILALALSLDPMVHSLADCLHSTGLQTAVNSLPMLYDEVAAK